MLRFASRSVNGFARPAMHTSRPDPFFGFRWSLSSPATEVPLVIEVAQCTLEVHFQIAIGLAIFAYIERKHLHRIGGGVQKRRPDDAQFTAAAKVVLSHARVPLDSANDGIQVAQHFAALWIGARIVATQKRNARTARVLVQLRQPGNATLCVC